MGYSEVASVARPGIRSGFCRSVSLRLLIGLAGAVALLIDPSLCMTRPVGEWNTARIVAQGKHVEHWLNDVKVVEYDVDSDVWRAHVKTSKFFPTAYGQGNWGRAKRGHIGLQDYGGAIEFRNIKIRRRTVDRK